MSLSEIGNTTVIEGNCRDITINEIREWGLWGEIFRITCEILYDEDIAAAISDEFTLEHIADGRLQRFDLMRHEFVEYAIAIKETLEDPSRVFEIQVGERGGFVVEAIIRKAGAEVGVVQMNEDAMDEFIFRFRESHKGILVNLVDLYNAAKLHARRILDGEYELWLEQMRQETNLRMWSHTSEVFYAPPKQKFENRDWTLLDQKLLNDGDDDEEYPDDTHSVRFYEDGLHGLKDERGRWVKNTIHWR